MTDVQVTHVTYKNFGWTSAGDLYLPPHFDKSAKHAAIVSTHPIGSCKEQTSGNVYGVALAKAGIVVLAFDASFQGGSGGEPRFVEDPSIRVSDIRFAIDYLVTLPYVDEQRIGAIGVCGGGAYTIHAAITDHRIKALCSITGVNFGRLIREGFSNFNPVAALEAAGAQRTALARGAAPGVINYLPAAWRTPRRRASQTLMCSRRLTTTSRRAAPSRTARRRGCLRSAARRLGGMRFCTRRPYSHSR